MRVGREVKGSLPRSLPGTLARARPPSPGPSAGCWQGELTLRAKEKLNKWLCRSLRQCLLSSSGHEGKTLKPPWLCSSASTAAGL